MAGLSGTCEVYDCLQPAAALVVTDLEELEDGEVVDYTTQLVPMCKAHAIAELSAQ